MLRKIILFVLMTMISSTIMVFSAYEDKFPRIAFSPPYIFQDPSNYSYNTYFTQAKDTLGLTALVQNLWVFKDADFASAASDSLNLVNAWTAYYSYGQYSMYQADRINEYDWFQPYDPNNQIRFMSTRLVEDNAGHGRQIQDTTIHDTTVYAWFVSKDNPDDNRGYVLYDLWNERTGPFKINDYAIDYSREQEKYDRKYTVNFKLKVPSGYSPADTVANLEVYFYRGGTVETILAESLLLYNHFESPGQYQSFKDTFWLPPYTLGDYIDYRVKWYKQTDLYIDYVEVYDHIYDSLFNVKYPPDTTYTVYQWKLINDPNIINNEQFHGSSLYRWCLQDQPTYDQFRSSRRVNEILYSKDWVPGIQAAGDFDYINTYRYMNEVNPHELFYDDYPIWRDATPENDNDAWQNTLDSFAVRLNKIADAAKSMNKEWWYITQTFKSLTNTIPRYPHNSELKAMVYMALAYGTKGIGYFEYASRGYSEYDVHGGLVDSLTGRPVETYPDTGNSYYSEGPETLLTAVKEINKKLDTLGSILSGLEWKWAGSIDSVGDAPGSFVSWVSGVDCENCTGGDLCKDPTLYNYIQVGMFKDNSKGEDYLFLVNRWVADAERPCERVELQRDRYSYLYDCLTGELLDTLAGNGFFYVYLLPGEGKLFRLANFLTPYNLSGHVEGAPQKIHILWTDPNVNESGYKIERKIASLNDWPEIGSVGANVTSFYDTTNLIGSETYKYRVKAFDQQYYSEYSNEATVKNIPNPPRNLTARLNRICCPGFASGGGGGMSINGICPYCYTNEIILSWQAPLNQKIGTLTQYRVRAWRGSWNHYQMVSSSYTSTTFCVPELGKSYNFEVYAIDSVGDLSNPSNYVSITSGTTDDCEGEPQAKIIASIVPEKFELFQNYPNPFNFGTVIKYALPEESNVKIVIYNLLGQKVRVLVEDTQSPGYYTIYWDGRNDRGEDITSGIYFYRIQTGSFTKTVKMSLLK